MKRKDFTKVLRQSIKTPQNWPYEHLGVSKSAALFYNNAMKPFSLNELGGNELGDIFKKSNNNEDEEDSDDKDEIL